MTAIKFSARKIDDATKASSQCAILPLYEGEERCSQLGGHTTPALSHHADVEAEALWPKSTWFLQHLGEHVYAISEAAQPLEVTASLHDLKVPHGEPKHMHNLRTG